MANVTVNGTNYTGVSEVRLPITNGGGTEQSFVLPPVTQEKTVTPSTSTQNVTPDSGKYLTQVTVNAIQMETKSVTPSAEAQTVTPSSGKFLTGVSVAGDADLVAGNIKSGVNIFGVTGTYSGGAASLQSKTVTPGVNRQTVSPDSGYDGLSQVTVNGDADLLADNIRLGKNIFGVEGAYGGTITLKWWSAEEDGE